MVKPIRNEPNFNAATTGQATNKGTKTPYESTTAKVQANAGKIAVSPSKANMKGHKVSPQASGDNLASLVTKGSGKQRAQAVTSVSTPVFGSNPFANVKKIRSAHIAKPTPKVDAAAKKVLGKIS